MTRRRALVLWADSKSANLGVRVLAAGSQALISRVDPSIEIDFQDFGPNADGFNPGKKLVARDLMHRNKLIDNWVSQYDIVLDTGAGDSLTDIYGAKRLLMMCYTQRAAVRTHTPLVFMPQTIGPFRSSALRRIARANLEKAEAVFSRDSLSTKYAKHELDITARAATDVVFALDAPTSTPKSKQVVLNVSGLIWNDNPHVDYRKYRSYLAQLTKESQARGLSVTLLAHVLQNPYSDNDARIMNEAADFLGADEVAVPSDLASARSQLAGATAVIGSRMHACLNALSVGTPSYSWAYSRKFAPLLDDLGWTNHADLRDDVSPVRDTLRFVDDAVDGRLNDPTAALRVKANHTVTEVVDSLKVVLTR